jgi:basic amino acid/polyamine antiporter, APA family
MPFVAQRPGSAPLISALAGAMVAGFFSFGGWWDLSKLTGEVYAPERTVPRALILGVIIVTLVYILTSAVFIYLVPLERVTTSETFAAQAGAALFGAAGGRILAMIVIVSIFGSLAAVMMSAPRVYYAMARDGLFFKAAAALHPRFGTPARAIVLQALLAALLAALGTFEQIIAYFIFITVCFIALTVAAVFVLRRRRPYKYRTPGYPYTPLLFLLFVAVLLILLGGNSPRQALFGTLLVALGVPVYQWLFRRAANH